jgi:hypothetical protein
VTDASRGRGRGHRRSAVPARLIALLVAGALMPVLLGVGASSSSAAEGGDRTSTADRVLVLSLPTVTWTDLQRVHTPNLDRILRAGAVGNLVTNGVERPASLADAYLSLGAGARATAGAGGANDDGLGFGVGEPFGRDRAGTVFRNRTGTAPGRGLVFMDVNDVTESNDAELYGADVGLLGRELSQGGVGRDRQR